MAERPGAAWCGGRRIVSHPLDHKRTAAAETVAARLGVVREEAARPVPSEVRKQLGTEAANGLGRVMTSRGIQGVGEGAHFQ